jgi:hypothetical protein
MQDSSLLDEITSAPAASWLHNTASASSSRAGPALIAARQPLMPSMTFNQTQNNMQDDPISNE